MNDKLSRQLEYNMSLLGDLNTELEKKDKEIVNKQKMLDLKSTEVNDLSQQLQTMQSKVHRLAEMTKQYQETSDKEKSNL